MPLYLDVHPLYGFTREDLLSSVEDEADEFGVQVVQMLYNESENLLYCICSAPNIDAVHKHHETFNVKCDRIIPIDHIKTDKYLKDEKLKLTGELSARIAHDIRNPLNIIQFFTDKLRTMYPEVYEKEAERFDMAYNAINRIKHQASGVLGFLTTKDFEYEKTKLSEIVESSLSGLNIPSKVTVEKPENDFEITCDAIYLEVVFVNILSNALQAIGSSGKITIRAESQDGFVQISFENTGPSIPDNLTSKIFEPLFTTKQEGTGLGLVSCKNIVERHGGKILVSNDPVTFTILIPDVPKSELEASVEHKNN